MCWLLWSEMLQSEVCILLVFVEISTRAFSRPWVTAIGRWFGRSLIGVLPIILFIEYIFSTAVSSRCWLLLLVFVFATSHGFPLNL